MGNVKCSNCKGTGFVPLKENRTKFVKCPCCQGKGSRREVNKK